MQLSKKSILEKNFQLVFIPEKYIGIRTDIYPMIMKVIEYFDYNRNLNRLQRKETKQKNRLLLCER